MNNFNLISKINTKSLVEKLNKLTKKDWEIYKFRQETFEVHKHTESIPLIFDEDFRTTNPTKKDKYILFKKELSQLEKLFNKVYGKGILIRALLIKMKKLSKINSHIDTGESLSRCHRVHIPLRTNKNVLFTIDNETKNLKQGEVWEINNSNKYHSVYNNSKIDRIHLVVDWII